MSSEIKPNSHKYKEEQQANSEKRVEKVVTGTVKTKKKTGVSKFADVFVSEDAANVKSYILLDVLIPAAKKLVSDIVTDGINMILYGESGRNKKHTTGSTVSYGRFFDSPKKESSASSNRSNSRFDLEELIFESRAEVNAVIDQMQELIDRFEEVSVADLYDMVDLTAPYTANRYGWTSTKNAEAVHTKDGWIIKLPKPKLL